MYVKVCEFPSIIQQEYDLVFNLKSLFDHVHWLEYALLCAQCCVLVCGAYIDWAAHQGASIQSFVDDPVKVSGGAAELVHLRHAARKVLKPFCGASARQSLVGSIQPGTMEKHFALTPAAEALKNLASRGSSETILGVRLLQECTPEFIALSRMDKHQLAVFDRQPVINHHVYPLAELPELQDKSDNQGLFREASHLKDVLEWEEEEETWKWKIPA